MSQVGEPSNSSDGRASGGALNFFRALIKLERALQSLKIALLKMVNSFGSSHQCSQSSDLSKKGIYFAMASFLQKV